MDQKTLAARLGVTQSAISRWETGADAPSQAMIRKLKDVMAENDPVRVERVGDRLYVLRDGVDAALQEIWDRKRTAIKVFSFQRAYGAGAPKIAAS